MHQKFEAKKPFITFLFFKVFFPLVKQFVKVKLLYTQNHISANIDLETYLIFICVLILYNVAIGFSNFVYKFSNNFPCFFKVQCFVSIFSGNKSNLQKVT